MKDIKKCYMLKNPSTSIIYSETGDIIKGQDLVGPELANRPCSNFEFAKKNKLINILYNKQDLNFQDNTKFYFFIRGHIRNSFKSNKLKDFVKLLKIKFPNIIFILQTWKNINCNNDESWRNIKNTNEKIDLSKIQNYFNDEKITNNCIIIDEKTIKLTGSVNGKICNSLCPKKGWKNMWYGINKGIESINDDTDNIKIVSFRYDYFDIPQSNNINFNIAILFIKKSLNSNNIEFIKDSYDQGVDNFYIGNLNQIKQLVFNFNYNLDYILNIYKLHFIFHQEILVPKVVNDLINKIN
tara:strand:+ start:1705 stop:2595 length:891 start_codon:yes stop_codon:yes gene_type:complete